MALGCSKNVHSLYSSTGDPCIKFIASQFANMLVIQHFLRSTCTFGTWTIIIASICSYDKTL